MKHLCAGVWTPIVFHIKGDVDQPNRRGLCNTTAARRWRIVRWRLKAEIFVQFFTTSLGRASPSIRWHDDVSQILGNCTCRQGKKDEDSAFIQEMIGWAPTTSIPRGCRFVPYNYTVPKTSRHRWCLGMEKILVIHQGLGQFLWAYIFRVVVSLGGFWGHLLSCPQIFATLMNGFSTNPPPKMPTHPGEYLLKCFNGVWSVVFFGGPQYRTFSASVSSMPRDSVYIKEQFLYSWLPQQQISKVSHCEVRRGSHAGLWKHLQTRGFCWQRQPAHPRIFAHSDRQFVMGNPTLETATRRFSFR